MNQGANSLSAFTRNSDGTLSVLSGQQGTGLTPTSVTVESSGKFVYVTNENESPMSRCAARLFGFKRSGVQELLGWYDPKEYPIRNANTNAGMRFLGYDVRAD